MEFELNLYWVCYNKIPTESKLREHFDIPIIQDCNVLVWERLAQPHTGPGHIFKDQLQEWDSPDVVPAKPTLFDDFSLKAILDVREQFVTEVEADIGMPVMLEQVFYYVLTHIKKDILFRNTLLHYI